VSGWCSIGINEGKKPRCLQVIELTVVDSPEQGDAGTDEDKYG